MPRGGARPGAGRKARAVKAVEATIAERIFRSLGGEAQAWEDLIRLGYANKLKPGEGCVDLPRLAFVKEILVYWTDRKYGKPTLRTELAGQGGAPVSLIVDL